MRRVDIAALRRSMPLIANELIAQLTTDDTATVEQYRAEFAAVLAS